MISVVVPLYNYAQYIEENIRYTMQQTIKDWEIIIVDDCSKDDPLSVIQPYISDKIRYIRLDKNVGYGAAKNAGIRAANGDYIVVLDADDLLVSNSLEIRLNYLKKHKGLWIHAKAYEFNDKKPYKFRYKKRKYVRRFARILKTKNYDNLWENMHAQTVMVHRKVYQKIGLYEPKLRSMGDKEMWARIINNIGIPLYLKKFVVYYRQHSGQMHRSKKKLRRVDKYLKILNRCMKQRCSGDFSKVENL